MLFKGISQYYANENIMVTCLWFHWLNAITSLRFDWTNGIFTFVFVIINKPKKVRCKKIFHVFSSALYLSCMRGICFRFVLIHHKIHSQSIKECISLERAWSLFSIHKEIVKLRWFIFQKRGFIHLSFCFIMSKSTIVKKQKVF